MWVFSYKGIFSNGRETFPAYSGNAGPAKNNPDYMCVVGVGPIPFGLYRFGAAWNHPHLGPLTIEIIPQPGTNTCGRSLFRLHGDSIANPGTASNGCIVAPRAARLLVVNGSDKLLRVTP